MIFLTVKIPRISEMKHAEKSDENTKFPEQQKICASNETIFFIIISGKSTVFEASVAILVECKRNV